MKLHLYLLPSLLLLFVLAILMGSGKRAKGVSSAVCIHIGDPQYQCYKTSLEALGTVAVAGRSFPPVSTWYPMYIAPVQT